jgi:TRAP-type uncharacterized transport system substrate-binding protein
MVVALMETFGLNLIAAFVVSAVIILFGALGVLWVFRSAPPRTITMISGPPGSTFERYALAYQKSLAAAGVRLNIVPSGGSLENLQRLRDPKSGIDFGFVQGGLTEGIIPKNLSSLGSVAYQPIWLFYRGATRMRLLSELAGKRIAVGLVGSGTHPLAFTLLRANGVTPDNATLLDEDAEAAAAALIAGNIDAVFLMGDSAPLDAIKTLAHADGIQMYDWMQADAYTRRYSYLNRMRLPQGTIDFGKNLPDHDVALVGPAVELLARKGLNSAISDLLLDTARGVHGKAGLLQKPGEFPAPLEHEFTLSDDADRFYKSGPSLSALPFWMRSLVKPILVAIVPALLVLIPALRSLPVLYRLRIRLRIFRVYRPLLQLERDASGPLTREHAHQLLARLDQIEELADRVRVPASFGDQFYELRTHILFVRKRLRAAIVAPVERS